MLMSVGLSLQKDYCTITSIPVRYCDVSLGEDLEL